MISMQRSTSALSFEYPREVRYLFIMNVRLRMPVQSCRFARIRASTPFFELFRAEPLHFQANMAHSNDAFDAEISKMFGSLSLRAWAPDASSQVRSCSMDGLNRLSLITHFIGSSTTAVSESFVG